MCGSHFSSSDVAMLFFLELKSSERMRAAPSDVTESSSVTAVAGGGASSDSSFLPTPRVNELARRTCLLASGGAAAGAAATRAEATGSTGFCSGCEPNDSDRVILRPEGFGGTTGSAGAGVDTATLMSSRPRSQSSAACFSRCFSLPAPFRLNDQLRIIGMPGDRGAEGLTEVDKALSGAVTHPGRLVRRAGGATMRTFRHVVT